MSKIVLFVDKGANRGTGYLCFSAFFLGEYGDVVEQTMDYNHIAHGSSFISSKTPTLKKRRTKSGIWVADIPQTVAHDEESESVPLEKGDKIIIVQVTPPRRAIKYLSEETIRQALGRKVEERTGYALTEFFFRHSNDYPKTPEQRELLEGKRVFLHYSLGGVRVIDII